MRSELQKTKLERKGKVKDIAGEVAGDASLEEKGERENQAGRERQRKNDAT
jgi:uncharacterized protein YjbJ (UPF0337 family)